MSIPFSVAAVLARGAIAEDNYAQIADPQILGLVDRTDLQCDSGFTAAFLRSKAPRVVSACGMETPFDSTSTMSLPPRRRKSVPAFDRLPPTSSATGARCIWEELVDSCEFLSDSRVIAAKCRLEPIERLPRPAS